MKITNIITKYIFLTKLKLSKLKVSSATIGPSKSQGSDHEDHEAPTETLTETGVEVMRKKKN